MATNPVNTAAIVFENLLITKYRPMLSLSQRPYVGHDVNHLFLRQNPSPGRHDTLSPGDGRYELPIRFNHSITVSKTWHPRHDRNTLFTMTGRARVRLPNFFACKRISSPCSNGHCPNNNQGNRTNRTQQIFYSSSFRYNVESPIPKTLAAALRSPAAALMA